MESSPGASLGQCLGREAWLQKSRGLSDCGEGIGWTKRGSASEFFIPKQEETRRRASHLCGVTLGQEMNPQG